jgi:hypothetical protein
MLAVPEVTALLSLARHIMLAVPEATALHLMLAVPEATALHLMLMSIP